MRTVVQNRLDKSLLDANNQFQQQGLKIQAEEIFIFCLKTIISYQAFKNVIPANKQLESVFLLELETLN